MFQKIDALIEHIRSNLDYRHLLADTMHAVRVEVTDLRARLEKLEMSVGLIKPADEPAAVAAETTPATPAAATSTVGVVYAQGADGQTALTTADQRQ